VVVVVASVTTVEQVNKPSAGCRIGKNKCPLSALRHVVRDGSRTTANYESDDPEMLTDVALATDCVIALIQQHYAKPLFAVDEEGFAGDRRAGDSRNAEKTESWWWRRMQPQRNPSPKLTGNREFPGF
jgi:hypothetical protein